jgi:outer membrane protein assembly factor BamA/autotransporter translocation and assembly factor TamB
LWLGASTLGGAVAIAVLIHLPPVRQAVLNRAIAILRDTLNVDLQADRLDYNLFALRVSLSDARVSAAGQRERPFLVADRITITVPRSSVLGPFAIESIDVDHGRVRIVRDTEGRSNLPTTAGGGDEEPGELRVYRLAVPDLAIDVVDEPAKLGLSLPALTLSVGRDSGRLQLTKPGQLTRGGLTTRIRELDGGLSFDGRALHLAKMTLGADEASVAVDGTLSLLVRKPGLDLGVSGTGDVARLARWGGADVKALDGTVAVDGTVSGPLDRPAITATVRSHAIAWRALSFTDVTADVRANETVELARLDARLAGGRLSGRGNLPLGNGDTRVSASWQDVDLEKLTRLLAVETPMRPSARATGTLDANGPGFDINRWNVSIESRTTPGTTSPRQLALAGNATLRLKEGSWTLAADQKIAGLPLRAALAGRLNLDTPGRSTLAGTVQLLDTPVRQLLDVLRQTGTAAIDLPDAAGTLTADSQLSGTFASPSGELAIVGRDLRGAGIANLALDATVRGTLDRAQVDLRLTQPEGNTVMASGTVLPRGAQLDLNVDGTLANLPVLLPQIPVDGRAALRFEATGPFGALRGSGRLTVDDAAYEGYRFGPVESAIELDATSARIEAAVPELNATTRATIALDTRQAALDLAVSDADLTRLLRGVETPAPVTGRFSLVAHGSGPLDDWRAGRASVDVSSFEAKVGELPVRLARPAVVAYLDRVIAVTRLDATAGKTSLSVAGRLPLAERDAVIADADTLRATVTGDLGEAMASLAATGLVDVSAIDGHGPVALLARVGRSLERPAMAANLELGPGSIAVNQLPAITNLQMRAQLDQGWFELREATGAWQGAQVVARGRVPLRLFQEQVPPRLLAAFPRVEGPASMSARATSITPAVLSPFLDPDTLSQIVGGIDASVDLETSSLDLTDVRGEARLDRLDLRIANLPVTQRMPTRIVARNGFARVAAWEWASEGATLDVDGQVRLADRQAAILANGSVDLRMLTPFVRRAGISTAGRLEPKVSITGPLDTPRVDGDVTLSSGEIRLAEPRVIATDLGARAVLTRTGARLTSLSGTVNGGRLTGTGDLEYGPDAPASVRLTTDTRGMALNFPEGLRSELNAALGLTLQIPKVDPPSGTLSGTVTVARSAYRDPLVVVTGLLAALRTSQAVAQSSPEPDSLLHRLALDTRLVTDEDIVVNNNVGDLQLGADLRVIGPAAAPTLSGRANLREGGRLFLGRNIYTIDSGTIDFANPVLIEPDLDINARTRAGGVEIVLHIKGTPDRLETELSAPTSAEPIGQADLASLLITGRQLNQISGAEAQIVGEQVLGYLSGDVLGLASRAIGLDTIRLGGLDAAALRRDPTAIATQTDPTSRLTFGKSIGANLDVTFSQSLRRGDAQTWIVEYRPARRFETRFVSDDEDLRSYGFRHDVAFGGGGLATRSPDAPRRREITVTEVTFTGTPLLPEARLKETIKLRPNDTFDFSEWQRDRDRLEELYQREGYREARLSARRDERNESVALTYDITAGPRTAVSISGYDLPAAVRRRIDEAWNASVYDAFLAEEAEGIVREALARDGYLRATTKVSFPMVDSTKTMTIAIDPGPRIRTRRIALRGVDETLAREIDTWIDQRHLREQAWSDTAMFDRELTAYLRGRGHARARVTIGAPEFDESMAVLPVTVDAGPLFTLSRVVFEGARSLDVNLANIVGLMPGNPYDAAAVDGGRERLIGLYRREGFPSVRVTTRPVISEDTRQAAVTFEVEEGPRQTIQEIVVTGNASIHTDVITRALDLKTGQPLGTEAWLRARKRLFDTGLFRRVDLSTEPLASPGPGDAVAPMRVRVTVQEWPALRLRYGFQVAEERPEREVEGRTLVPGISADVTRRTLFGRAVTLGAVVDYERRQRSGRAFANAPTLFGRTIESSVVLESARQEFTEATLITDRTRLAWEQRFNFLRNMRLSYSYGFERNHTFDTAPDPNSPVGPFDLTVHIARLNASAVYDTRNDPSDSTRGLLVSGHLEYAPEKAGSDIRFVRYLTQAYYFRPAGRVVLASAARVGVAKPLGGQELIPSERFFAGGARTVRGVREEGLGPRNFLGDAIGGESLLVLNEEARFPVYKWLRGVVFVDAGNVFAVRSPFDLGGLVGAVGLGARFATPFALLRVDYGRQAWGSAPRAGQWYFGIGHTF